VPKYERLARQHLNDFIDAGAVIRDIDVEAIEPAAIRVGLLDPKLWAGHIVGRIDGFQRTTARSARVS
jgi:hypothetical protein